MSDFETYLNQYLPEPLRPGTVAPGGVDPDTMKAARAFAQGKAAYEHVIAQAQQQARRESMPEAVAPELRNAASRALSTMAAAGVRIDGSLESVLNSAAGGNWPVSAGTKAITNALKAAESALNERRLAEQQQVAAEHGKPIIAVAVSFSAKGMRFPAGTYAIEAEALAELEVWRQGMEAQKVACGWGDLSAVAFSIWPPYSASTIAESVGAH